MDYKIRRFKKGDEDAIVSLIRRTLREVNIKDYSKETIKKIVKEFSPNIILNRAKSFHMYVAVVSDLIVGVGAIGPYWDSSTEYCILNLYVLPEYENMGIGKAILNALEEDEFFRKAERIEVSSTISAVSFYKHMGYVFKKDGDKLDLEGYYRLEKFPHKN